MRDLGRPSWDELFISQCYLAAQASPDPRTKHGAILVDEFHKVCGFGFNGFPRGWDDKNLPLEAPQKYDFMIHSELNCMFNCQKPHNIHLATMYISGHPCMNCFVHMAQYGIKNIIYGMINSKMVDISKIKQIHELAHLNKITMREVPITTSLLEKTIAYVRGKIEDLGNPS